ncbi:hypothetical protein ACFFX0_22525 [Citricoccus parietis]|uniref:Uncharacterized protein n=1 Tax=Citricoccus parietis TaxID=592307 RepID=A0ABV5G4G5_9MICC
MPAPVPVDLPAETFRPALVSPLTRVAMAVDFPEFIEVPSTATTVGRPGSAAPSSSAGSPSAGTGFSEYGAKRERLTTPDASASRPSGSILVGSSMSACCTVTVPATPPAATRWQGSRESGTWARNWSAA